jgi:hypothetical protein
VFIYHSGRKSFGRQLCFLLVGSLSLRRFFSATGRDFTVYTYTALSTRRLVFLACADWVSWLALFALIPTAAFFGDHFWFLVHGVRPVYAASSFTHFDPTIGRPDDVCCLCSFGLVTPAWRTLSGLGACCLRPARLGVIEWGALLLPVCLLHCSSLCLQWAGADTFYFYFGALSLI